MNLIDKVAKFFGRKDSKDSKEYKDLIKDNYKDFSSRDEGQSINVPDMLSWDPDTGHTGVESSFYIKSLDYDAPTQKLRLSFRPNSSYFEYDNVPKEVVEGMMKAASKGRYFHRRIKDKYNWREI